MNTEVAKAVTQYKIRRLEFKERKMEQFERTQRRKAAVRLIMGLFLGTIVASALVYMFLKPIPEGNKDVIITLVSGLSGAFFGSVIGYYFGDSDNAVPNVPSFDEADAQDSSDKDDKEDRDASSIEQEP